MLTTCLSLSPEKFHSQQQAQQATRKLAYFLFKLTSSLVADSFAPCGVDEER